MELWNRSTHQTSTGLFGNSFPPRTQQAPSPSRGMEYRAEIVIFKQKDRRRGHSKIWFISVFPNQDCRKISHQLHTPIFSEKEILLAQGELLKPAGFHQEHEEYAGISRHHWNIFEILKQLFWEVMFVILQVFISALTKGFGFYRCQYLRWNRDGTDLETPGTSICTHGNYI